MIGELAMNDKSLELMKKLIEDKKKKGQQQEHNTQLLTQKVGIKKAAKRNKKGGLFDK